MAVIRVEMLFSLVIFALWVFCVVDVINTDEGSMRNLPKVAWLLIVLLFPFVGSVAWLAAGRPTHSGPRQSRFERSVPQFPEYDRPGRAAASDPQADDDFLRGVRERAEEQRRLYREKKDQDKKDQDKDGES